MWIKLLGGLFYSTESGISVPMASSWGSGLGGVGGGVGAQWSVDQRGILINSRQLLVLQAFYAGDKGSGG